MIQKILLGFCCLCWVLVLDAKPISKAEAQLVAQNFYQTTDRGADLGTIQLSIAEIMKTRLLNASSGQMEDQPLYYVFNVNTQDGFVMISADDAALPILAYATKGHFDPSIQAENYLKWVEGYKEQLLYIMTENIQATTEITERWESLRKGLTLGNGRSASAVNPLLGAIQWNQNSGGGVPFNAQCPYDNGTGSRAVVGCVATAMAQIMKYWGHPTQGTGFHSYNHSTYGTQSVNYGSTTYNWASMPDATSSSESAKLSYHCGVAVDMMYSPSGSGAYSADAKDALKDYFDYNPALQYLARSSYSDFNWKQLLKTDLDNSMPLYYAGSGSGGGHAFVCDGYDNGDNFHYNWGWGGAYDGFFNVNALNPSGVGTGGGSGGFNSNHRVIRGIQPNSGGGGGTAELSLNSSLSLNVTSPFQYGTSFQISAVLGNSSSANFSGDIACALLDNSNNFVDWVELKTSQSVATGGNTSLTFSSNTLTVQPAPGSYSVVLYQKTSSAANWTLVSGGSFSNNLPFTIQMINSGGMELYANITPATNPMVLGSTVSVGTNFWNNSTTNFTGKFSIDLHNMQGNYIMTIEEVNLTLSAGNVYSNNIDFSMANFALTAGNEAGTYQLAAWVQPAGGAWELVGNGSYFNPIQVDVAEPAAVGDAYENNNSISAAHNLTANFSGNTAIVNTPGTNIHNGADSDYFKVVLPAGYSYFIDAEVLDSYNTPGGTYDNDVLFSFDNGAGWSDSYDNSTGGIMLGNGGTVYFKIASFYQGQMGTYEFKATIQRGTVNINEILDDATLMIYPVPANAYLTLEFNEIPSTLNQVEIYNALGQRVHTVMASDLRDRVHSISTQDWTSGSYWMLLNSSDAITRKSFIVTH